MFNASHRSHRQAGNPAVSQPLCSPPASQHSCGRVIKKASLYDALVLLPVLQDYLRAFPQATTVPLRIAPTRTASRCAIVVPVRLEGQAVAYLVANPPEHDFPARRRQGIRQLLRVFARNLSALANRYLTTPCNHAAPCVLRADEYIHAHFNEPLHIADVAHRVGFCADHFGRVFSRGTGLTFTNYVARVRVEKAKELLTTTEQRVNEVAFACGFESIPHFDRVFKRQTGQTPREYRAAHARGAGI